MSRLAPIAVLFTLILASLAGVAQSLPPSASRETAYALEQQGQLAEAEDAWRTVLRKNPASAEACAHIAFLESEQQHYAQAVVFDRKAMALNPHIPGLQMNFGLDLFKAGDLREAVRVFAPLYHRASPDSSEAQRLRILIGMADYGSGNYVASVPYLRDAMARDPQNLPYRLVLAHSCLWSKQYQCVLDVYRQILNLNAESAEADMLAGEAYDEMRDHEEAITQFRNAIKEDPRFPGVHFGLGYILWSEGHFEEAVPEFELEVENNSSSAEALAYWADSDIHLNRFDLARPLIDRALKLNSKQELPWLDFGILDMSAHDNVEALHALRTAESLAPDDVRVHWRLARLYKATGHPQEARAEFAKTQHINQTADNSVFKLLRSQHSGDQGGGNGSNSGSTSAQP